MAQGQHHGADKEFLEVYHSIDELLLAKTVNLKYIPYEEQLRIGNVLDVPDNASGRDCIGLGSALGINPLAIKAIAHRNRETGATMAIFDVASKNQKSYFDVFRFFFDKNIDGTDRLLHAWPAVKEGYMEHEGVPRRGEQQQEAMMEGVQDSWNCPEANLFSHNDSATEIKSAIGRNLGRTGHEITGCHGNSIVPDFCHCLTRPGSSGRYGDGRVHSYNGCHGPDGTGCYGNSDYIGCRHSYSRRENLAPRCVNQHGDLPQAPPTSEQSMSINNLSLLKEDKESVVSCSDNCQVPLLPPVSLAAPPTNRNSSAPLGPWDRLQSVQRDSDTESGISGLDRPAFHDTLPKPSSRYVEDVVEPNVRQGGVANLDVGGFRACGRSQVSNPRNAIGERKTPAVSYIPNIIREEIELDARVGEVVKISNNNNGQRISYITNDGQITNVNEGQRPRINGEQMAYISNGQRTNISDGQGTNVNDEQLTNINEGPRTNNEQLTNIPTTVTECLSSDTDSETGRAPLLATPPSLRDSETGRALLLAAPPSLRDCETGRAPLLAAPPSLRDCETGRAPLLSTPPSLRDWDDGYPSDSESDPGPSASQVGIPLPHCDLGRGGVLPRVVEGRAENYEGVIRWNGGTHREEGELSEEPIPRREERAATDPTKFMFVMCPATNEEDGMMADLVKYLVCNRIAFVIDLLGGLLYSNEMKIADSNPEIVGQNRKIYKELFDKAQLVLIVKDDNRERSNHGYQNRVNNIISWAREENRLKRRTERIVFIHSNNMNVTKNLTKIKKRFLRN